MNKTIALFFLFASIQFTVKAQQIKQPKYKISQFQLSFGGDRSLVPLNINQNEFNVLAPGAQIPANSTPYNTQFGWDAPTLNMNVAFHPLKKNGLARGHMAVRGFSTRAHGCARVYNEGNFVAWVFDDLKD